VALANNKNCLLTLMLITPLGQRKKAPLLGNNDCATVCLSGLSAAQQRTFPHAVGFRQLSITGTDHAMITQPVLPFGVLFL
jgi:hypothetical protein